MARQPLVDQGLPIVEASRSHSHMALGRTERVISPTQRLVPDNTQPSQETERHAPGRFEPKIPAGERPQTHALDRAATRIGTSESVLLHIVLIRGVREVPTPR